MTPTEEPEERRSEAPPIASQPKPPDGDRGISPIAGKLGGRYSKLITLAGLGLGCGIFLFATWDRGDSHAGTDPEPDEPARQLVPFEPARRPAKPPLLTDAAVDPAAPTVTGADDPVPPLTPAAAGSAPAQADVRKALAESARRSPVLAYSRASLSAGQAVGPGAVDVGASPVPQARVTALDTLRQTSAIGQARAGALADRNLVLTAGAALPCILQTAMDSTTPGYVSCILPSDVYSESGSVVLMERGTRVLGEYQGGLQQGRKRLFVVWNRAVTPAGVTIGLASPASDALGRAGFDGDIATHFWARFGGALLLSLVDDGLYAAVGRDDAARNTARVPSDAAGVALQSSVDIPATLRKAQGAEVSIFVAQDLNFTSVYRLSLR